MPPHKNPFRSILFRPTSSVSCTRGYLALGLILCPLHKRKTELRFQYCFSCDFCPFCAPGVKSFVPSQYIFARLSSTPCTQGHDLALPALKTFQTGHFSAVSQLSGPRLGCVSLAQKLLENARFISMSYDVRPFRVPRVVVWPRA